MCDEQRTQEPVDEEAVERPQEPDEDPQEPDEVPFFAKNEFTEALKEVIERVNEVMSESMDDHWKGDLRSAQTGVSAIEESIKSMVELMSYSKRSPGGDSTLLVSVPVLRTYMVGLVRMAEKAGEFLEVAESRFDELLDSEEVKEDSDETPADDPCPEKEG